MNPSNMDLSYWLTSITHNILNNIITETENNIKRDIKNFQADRKIKQNKNIPQLINNSHLTQHIQNLLNKFHSEVNQELEKIKSSSTKLTVNIQKSHNYLLPSPSPSPQMIRFNEKPRSLLQLSSHYEIYEQLKDIQKDIIFLDTETDGLPPNCNMLSICMTSIQLNKNPLESENYNEQFYYIKPNENYRIDYRSRAFQINKISQKNIDNGIFLSNLGEHIINTLQNKIVIGYNINSFDIPVLRNNLRKVKLKLPPIETIDLYNIQIKKHRRDLSSTLKDLICHPIEENVKHTATADTEACIRLFAAQIKKYNLPRTKELYQKSFDNLLQKI